MNEYGSSYQVQFNGGLQIPSGNNYTMDKNFPQPSRSWLDSAPHMTYTEYDHYLSISSSNRPDEQYPLHYSYRINLDYQYKNVKKVELISAVLPNQASSVSTGNILNEPLIIVDIDELNYIEFPNNKGSSPLKGFAILPLKAATQASGGFINPELGCIYHKSKVFKTPMANLNHITINLRDYQGDLYDFGQPNGTTDKEYQNHFVFKITTEETSREVINGKNVW